MIQVFWYCWCFTSRCTVQLDIWTYVWPLPLFAVLWLISRTIFPIIIQSRLIISLCSKPSGSDRYEILHMARQLCCHAMCNILLRYGTLQWSYTCTSKTNFPSNFNYRSWNGPLTTVFAGAWWYPVISGISVIIAADKDLLSIRCQAIAWTNTDLSSIGKYWPIMNRTVKNTFQWHFIRNSNIFIEVNAFVPAWNHWPFCSRFNIYELDWQIQCLSKIMHTACVLQYALWFDTNRTYSYHVWSFLCHWINTTVDQWQWSNPCVYGWINRTDKLRTDNSNITKHKTNLYVSRSLV